MYNKWIVCTVYTHPTYTVLYIFPYINIYILAYYMCDIHIYVYIYTYICLYLYMCAHYMCGIHICIYTLISIYVGPYIQTLV